MLYKNIFSVVLLSSLFMSCGGGKYAATEKIYRQKARAFTKTMAEQPAGQQIEQLNVENKEWVASVNFGMRRPNYVMIHHTAQNSTEQTIKTFHLERTETSAHYVIGRDGQVVQMVNDYFRAHHAGTGRWGNDTDLNSSSIGIELDNNGTTDPWPDVQIEALIQLLSQLKEKYKIPQANFIGHMDYAPTRKIDPHAFPWKRLADAGFGFWQDDIPEHAPENFDVRVALKVIGYDVKNLDAAVKAFKRHYIQADLDSVSLTAQEQAVLYNIMQKYL